MLFKKAFLCVSCALVTSQTAFVNSAIANDAITESMEEIVVSSLRLDTTLQQSGTSVSLISDELIRNRGYTYLSDAIASATGVTTNQNGAFGGQSSIRIRGANSDQTLVLIDGVPVNDTTSPGGGFDFGTIDILDVESVEILKGPQSTLWGTDAIGGVINIKSQPAAKSLGASINVETGSYDSHRIAGGVSAGNNIGNFSLSYSDVDSDGISKADEDDGNPEEDGFESTTLSFRGNLNLGDNARLGLIHREADATTEFDSFGAATGVQDGDEVSETEQQFSQLSAHFALFDGKLDNTVTYGRTTLDRENLTAGVSGFSADGERDLLRYQGSTVFGTNHHFSFGYETEDSESGPLDSKIDSTFALYRWQSTDDLSLSFGLRRDDHDTFGSETVGRIAAAWQVREDVLLHASWGEGFKAPTIFQTTFFCCGATAANTALTPESSDAFDIGAQYTFSRGTISATYFEQDTTDLIDFSFAIGGYENINKVESTGLEVEFNYTISDAWSLAANLTYLDSEDGRTGTDRVQLPEKSADIALTWQPTPASTTSLIAIHNGKEGNSRGGVSAWTRYDLSTRYSINESFELFARVENIFDKDYQQIIGYGTPERSAYAGMRYRL